MEIELFIPCYIDQFYPETGWNTVKILEKLGCKVHYNAEQTCCGHIAWSAGHKELARPIAEKWLHDFASAKNIVCPAGSCVSLIRNYYHEMFMNSSFHLSLRGLQAKTFELTEFLIKELDYEKLQPELKGKAVYHDACNALRECGIKAGPRKLLGLVKGIELLEEKDAGTCCGYGDSFSTKHEAISTAMAEQKVRSALEVQADYIISTDITCLMQLEGYIRKNKLAIKTMHIADVLASGW